MAEARSPSIHPTRPCQHTRSIHSKSPHRSHYPLDRLHFSLPTRSHLLWMRGRSASARFHRPDRTRSNAISFARFAMDRTGVFGSGRFAPARDFPMNTISFARFEKREVSFQIAQLKSRPKPPPPRSTAPIPAKTPDQLIANRANEIMAEARSPSIDSTLPCQDTRPTHSKSPLRSHYPLDRLHFSLPTRSHLLWMRGRSAPARFLAAGPDTLQRDFICAICRGSDRRFRLRTIRAGARPSHEHDFICAT